MPSPVRVRSEPLRLLFGGLAALVALASCTDFGDELVRPGPTVVVTPNAASIAVGDTLRFQAEARTSGQPIPGVAIVWSSSNETVARIDTTGLASGLAAGSTLIRASTGSVTSAPVTLQVGSAAGPDFATDVQPIFSRSCAVSGCHGGQFPAEGMSLEAGSAWAEIVDVRSISGVPMDIVEPGDPQNSMLYHKIALCDAVCISGERMPPAPRPHLSAAEIDVIQDWIAAGADP
jgi:hypothetical protein